MLRFYTQLKSHLLTVKFIKRMVITYNVSLSVIQEFKTIFTIQTSKKDAPSQQEVKKTKLYPIKYKGTKYYLEKYDESSKKMRGILYDYNAYKKNKMRI